ncbi:GNAT family N-acetyltransferase [Mycobacterium vicinigordonae]|uniref:GNAT family N-acetyltransferase n=1 Tax=Mycobacterium vicinigordonae TaxID=1719132 RepID=A0A7D6I1S3_9MYCO|nr:GNAT family N-acetyltransferase [Mycobacterium vicinigordonae]
MTSWPELGSRVALRYRRSPGSVPPLTDAIGHLLAVDPTLRLQTKTGTIVEVSPADVVSLRVLTDVPVRNADIRTLERLAAAARPGGEETWLDGWLLRAADGVDLATNSAVPLDISAQINAVPAIVDWYGRRRLTPHLALPDRLLDPPPSWALEHTERVLLRDMASGDFLVVPDDATPPAAPHGYWLHHRRRYFCPPASPPAS